MIATKGTTGGGEKVGYSTRPFPAWEEPCDGVRTTDGERVEDGEVYHVAQRPGAPRVSFKFDFACGLGGKAGVYLRSTRRSEILQ